LSSAALASTPTPVPAAFAVHIGPVRFAVFRFLRSGVISSLFVAGALLDGFLLGFFFCSFLCFGVVALFLVFVFLAFCLFFVG
ncbi:hypothetical protein ACOIDL_28190, partial [Klebsiella pneumoniae]